MYQAIAIDTFIKVILKLTHTFHLFYYFMAEIEQHIDFSNKERYFLRHLATPFSLKIQLYIKTCILDRLYIK